VGDAQQIGASQVSLVVAVETDRGAWIAADSYVGSPDGGTDRMHGGKIHRVGLATVGLVGNVALMQYMLDHLRLGERPLKTPVDRWIRARFKDALRGAPEDDLGVDAVVIIDGEVWTMDSDGAAIHSELGYAAVGVAASGAMHALWATHGMNPSKRLRRVLHAATLHSEGVAQPFDVRFVGPA